MNPNLLRFAGTGLFFLLIFVSGFGLSRSEKPLNVFILALHKLLSIAAVVFLAIIFYRINQIAPLSTVKLTAGAFTGLLFFGTIVTGGLLSTGKPVATIIFTLHQITPFLTVLSTAVTLYFIAL